MFAKNRKRVLALGAVVTACVALLVVWATVPVGATPMSADDALAAVGTPHILKVHHVGDAVPGAGVPLTYHGKGKVMQAQEISYAIFWEPSNLQNGNATQVSPTYNSLLKQYFGDVGGNGLYNNNTQYYQVVSGTKKFIINKSSFGGAWVDTSAYPASGCSDSATPGNCVTDLQIQAEVAKAISTKGWSAGLTHMFFVFTSKGEGSCFDGSSTTCAFTDYCAYHNYYTNVSGHPVIYANMPYTGTSLAGCGVSKSPNNDFDADSTINVTSHEQMEAVTDPRLNAWYESSGAEIGDKCAWNFGTLSFDGGKANENWNGHFYILQQEWDNSTGGCVQARP
ncbi:MAG TPA: hypothetical protein VJR48_17595 [Ktedonobacterales bacterium]|nr:hypothetical protein [Ktedonobacterales bacterium]